MRTLLTAALATLSGLAAAAEDLVLGFNYPKTGPYAAQGLDQLQAATIAVDEVNAAGGILGRKVRLAVRDSQSKVDVTKVNVAELIDQEKAAMIFGGSASNVAITAGAICQEKGVPFFGTLTYSTETTGEKGRRFVFRECYDSWAAAKVLADYMNKNFAGKKFAYITADYTWGHTTEASFRSFTGTDDGAKHRGTKTKFPGATEEDFKKAVAFAKLTKPDVLVVVEFGTDMVQCLKLLHEAGLTKTMQVVVPNLTLGMAEGAGPEAMEGVIGAIPWSRHLAVEKGWKGGTVFADAFAARWNRWPDTSGASAYTIVHEYKAAAERAGSVEGAAVVKALEGHTYTRLKDAQTWRAFDHQSIQSVFAVRCKPAAEVRADKFQLDYFATLAELPGDQAFKTHEEWKAARIKAGMPEALEKLPGE